MIGTLEASAQEQGFSPSRQHYGFALAAGADRIVRVQKRCVLSQVRSRSLHGIGYIWLVSELVCQQAAYTCQAHGQAQQRSAELLTCQHHGRLEGAGVKGPHLCGGQTCLSGLSNKSVSLSFMDTTLPSSMLMARGAGAEAANARLMVGV